MPDALLLSYRAVPARSRLRIARGALGGLGRFTRATTGARRAVVVTDRNVARHHAAAALAALAHGGVAAALVVLPAGERTKRPAVLAALWSRLARAGLGRHDAVVALGGGVIGDLAGFGAATWLRGVPWVCVPTSLLAQVDSAVGGKTGIDLAEGKNLAGAFHQPAGVLIDPDLLATLPARHRRAGLAEVVKAGFATDAALFRWVEAHATALAAGDPRALLGAVRRAVRAKAAVVLRDEREREGGPRTALNLGHTTAHALERALGYRRLVHGEAVALGLRVAAALSVRAAGLDPAARARLEAVLDRLGLPRRMPPVPLRTLLAAMAHDKKRGRAGVRWVLTPTMGHASVPRLIEGRLVRAALLEAGARV